MEPAHGTDRAADGGEFEYDPDVAFAQCLVTAVVMAVGAALGDILPSKLEQIVLVT